MHQPPREQLFAKATRYCSSQERSPHQVEEKLFKWGADKSQAEEIIQQLKNENFLSEERFANAYCHDKVEFNKWGKLKIWYGIQKYRLPDEIVDQGLANIDDERYHEIMNEQARKKWQSLNLETDQFIRKQKTINFLVRKGFETSAIYPVVDKLE